MIGPTWTSFVDAGVLERRSDGKFDLDDNRRRYILHLREERKRSPKSEADADFQRAKSELIRIRIQEKQRQLINAEEAYAMIDEMVGLFLTGLSGFAARCGGRDLATRRAIDQAVYDLRLRYPGSRDQVGGSARRTCTGRSMMPRR